MGAGLQVLLVDDIPFYEILSTVRTCRVLLPTPAGAALQLVRFPSTARPQLGRRRRLPAAQVPVKGSVPNAVSSWTFRGVCAALALSTQHSINNTSIRRSN